MSHFDYPVIDGVCPSWADIQVRAQSTKGGPLVDLGDISAIESGMTVEEGYQSEGGRVIKRTTGSAKSEASWTLYASGYQKLLERLLVLAPVRNGQALISLAFFNVFVQWTPPGSSKILERRIKGCRILSNKQSSTEGNDATQFEIPLSPIEVCDVINGIEVVLI